MGLSCRNSSRGSKGQRPLAGSRGAAPPKKIYILGSPKWENQGQNQVQSIKTEKTRKAEKSVRAVWSSLPFFLCFHSRTWFCTWFSHFSDPKLWIFFGGAAPRDLANGRCPLEPRELFRQLDPISNRSALLSNWSLGPVSCNNTKNDIEPRIISWSTS